MSQGGKPSAGFTIVETLIVLGVSAALAVSAMLLVSGRQNRTEFQVVSNAMKQKLEQVINETANGFYPNNKNFSCVGTGAIPRLSNSVSEQGTNSTCIFLGKAVEFGIGPNGAASFAVIPLAAKHYSSGTDEVVSFAEARPIAIAPTSTPGAPSDPNPNSINYTDVSTAQNGLSLYKAQYDLVSGAAPDAKDYVVFALADGLNEYTGDGSQSATQKLDLFNYDLDTVKWPAKPADIPHVVDNINKGIDESRVVKALNLCFSSGTTDQSTKYTITGQGQLAVTMKIYGGLTCDL